MAKKSEDNTLPVLTHILGLLTSFLGPLIVLLATDDKTSKEHSKTVLNWQFSVFIYSIAFFVLMVLPWAFFSEETLLLLPWLISYLSLFLLITASILCMVFSIIGAVKASKPELWKYPLSIPFFKVG